MRFLAIICLLFTFATAQAQESSDSTTHEKKGIIATVREKINDTKGRLTHPTDSIKQKLTSKTDSLQLSSTDSLQQLNNIKNKPADSVRQTSGNVISKINNKASTVNNKIDSIEQKINAPVNKVNAKITSVENKVQEKIGFGENGVNGEVNKVEGKIDNGFSKATDGTVKRPGEDVKLNAEGVEIPGTGKKLEEVKADVDVPGLDGKIPGAEKLKVPDPNLSVNGLKEKAGIEIPGEEKIKNITSESKKIDGKLAEGEKYETEVRQIKDGDLASTEKIPGLAEDKVENLKQAQAAGAELQKATAQQEKYAAMIARYKDKKALQAEIQRKALNVANEKLSQESPAFKEAQAQLAKAKKLNPTVESYKEFKQKRTNEMKGKPFREHILPGLTVQAYNTNKKMTIDWGLQTGYKFTTRLLAGAGALYRTSFSEQHKTFIKAHRVYGYRTYLNYGLYKSFYAHAEFAALFGNLGLKNQETLNQKVYNGYFGIGKRYDISRKLKGSVLMLYRAKFKNDMPSLTKINLRIEFNLDLKKRKKLY
jgi:hypothetical protein